jgi:Lrp/AsnC family transcriptional regulator, leucine-responsive regulatory protein
MLPQADPFCFGNKLFSNIPCFSNLIFHFSHSAIFKTVMPKQMDEIDQKILRILQERGRISNIDLSREIQRIIEGYHAQVNLGKMGITIKALIQITLTRQQEVSIHKFIESIMHIPEVVECYQVTGDYDYLLRVLTSDIEALDKLITDKISKIPEVGQIKSHIILSEIKHSRVVPFLTN